MSSVLSILSRPLVLGYGPRYSFSVTHSASIPFIPRTCHHFSPPTTCFRSSGPNQLMRTSAALLHEAKGIRIGDTAAQYGAGTCVFVLAVREDYACDREEGKTHNACRDSMVFRVPSSMNALTMWNALCRWVVSREKCEN